MSRQRIFVATHNTHKIAEISRILDGFEIVADDPGDIDENAPDFAGNASIKVRAIAGRHHGEWCLADDSGLEVAALGGEPGVRSARFAGEPCDMEANKKLLLERLNGVADRRANFTCAIALVTPSGKELAVEGRCYGRISEAPSGDGGFGYDPLFVPSGFEKSFAEIDADAKNAISHRGRALAAATKLIGLHSPRPSRTLSWLRLFRAVNFPTVPGDVLAGAAAAIAGAGAASVPLSNVAFAAIASLCLYAYGLADNDIIGAATDNNRPIANGEISLRAAIIARSAAIVGAIAAAIAGKLPFEWFAAALLLQLSIIAYNRKKIPLLMGLARGLNVACGAFAVMPLLSPSSGAAHIPYLAIAAIWTLYITAVTAYSRGEENDPAKRTVVGFLVGAIVYLQLAVLLAIALIRPGLQPVKPLLASGAAMLLLLRIFKFAMPRVQAS